MVRKRSVLYKYREQDGLNKIRGWLSEGMTMEKIAQKIGISYYTLINWKKQYPEIQAVFVEADEAQGKMAVASLYKLMQGWVDEETTTEEYYLNGKLIKDDPKFPVKKVTKKKYIPPNMGAIAFYLKCRHGWREKNDIDINVKQINPMAKLTTEELKKIAYGGNSEVIDAEVVDVE